MQLVSVLMELVYSYYNYWQPAGGGGVVFRWWVGNCSERKSLTVKITDGLCTSEIYSVIYFCSLSMSQIYKIVFILFVCF